MLSPAARAALHAAWLDQVNREILRRTAGPGEDNAGQVVDALFDMAERFSGSALSGDFAVELARLVQTGDYKSAEAARMAADISHAQASALLLATGNADAAACWITHYVRKLRRP